MIFAVAWFIGRDGLDHAVAEHEQDERIALCFSALPDEAKPTRQPTGQSCEVCAEAAAVGR